MKIAYSGIEGAFAHIAAMRLYPNEELISFKSFKEAYDAVVEKKCDAAVLPIENSYAGEVSQVSDLMFSGDLIVEDVYGLAITQNLLGIPGAKKSDIKKVISHPTALEQCENYIYENNFEPEGAVNTARAAYRVAKMNSKEVAAIASEETAALYGLEVIEKDINESKDNTTRFAVFINKEDEKPESKAEKKNAFILLFTVPNIAGGLAKAINIIGDYGFNMHILRSRPMKSIAWNYYFYVEAEGDITNEYGREMIARLSFWCDTVKIVGRYNLIEEKQDQ